MTEKAKGKVQLTGDELDTVSGGTGAGLPYPVCPTCRLEMKPLYSPQGVLLKFKCPRCGYTAPAGPHGRRPQK